MKLLAIAPKGREFLHSRQKSGYVSDASAQKICDILNKSKFMLQDGKVWHIYYYDFTMSNYVFQKFTIRKGIVKLKQLDYC